LAAPRVDRRLTAVLAADVVGYSRLVQRDEQGTLDRLKAHRKELVEPLVAEHGGRVVKLTGDGILCEFPSAVHAVACAVAIQRGMAEREAAVPEAERIRFRIGINVGDVVHEGGDIFGDGVNVAARLEALAEPGGVLLARNVHNQVKDKLAFRFEPAGRHRVKNIAEPVEVWRVVPDGVAAKSARGLTWRQPKAATAAALALLLLLSVGAAGWWWYGVRGSSDAGGPPVLGRPAVAVLPFDDFGGEERQQRLADAFTEATDCVSAVGGSVTNSTVSVVCGIPYEQFSQLMALAVSGRPGAYTELLQRLDALVPASSQVRVQAIARFFAIVGEASVPPEQLEAKLVEIAQRYQELLARVETPSSTDPAVQQLKEQARAALEAGDFARAEELLNQAKARDLAAIEQMQAALQRLEADLEARQLSAAEAAAANGDLMMTRIRYAEAARYYAEAVGLTPEKYAEQLSGRLTDWAVAAQDAGDYRTGLDAARRALALDEARLPTDDARLGSRLNNLANLYRATGRYGEAEPLYRRALAVLEKSLPSNHPHLMIGLESYAGLLDRLGRSGEAGKLRARAEAIRQQRERPPAPPPS
jgi:class 3 adenylate cyclase/tetratricopeptide (TPR) repeat protein